MPGWFICESCQCRVPENENGWIENEELGIRMLVCKPCEGASK